MHGACQYHANERSKYKNHVIEYWTGNDIPFEPNSDIDTVTYIIQHNLLRYVDLFYQILNIVKDLENLFLSVMNREVTQVKCLKNDIYHCYFGYKWQHDYRRRRNCLNWNSVAIARRLIWYKQICLKIPKTIQRERSVNVFTVTKPSQLLRLI